MQRKLHYRKGRRKAIGDVYEKSEYRLRPLWFWNEKPTEAGVTSSVRGLQYIHKHNREENFDVWYFASLVEDASATISVDGAFMLTAIDPKTEKRRTVACEKAVGETTFSLTLKKGDSLLLIGKSEA